MKALVVGCGLIGSDYGRLSHAGTYAQTDGTELIGGVDPDPRRRERFEAQWNVPAYESLHDALEVDVPNIASICTPSNVRFEQMLILCEVNVDAIWCEKPLAEKVSTGMAMVRMCEDAGVALQVNFQRRFDRMHQRAKEVDLGKRVHFNCRFSGDWLRVGCHAIDLYRWYIGEPEQWGRFGPHNVYFRTKRCTGLLTQVDGGKHTTIFDVDLVSPKARISLAAMGQQMFWGETEDSMIFPGVREQRLSLADTAGLRHAMSFGLDSLLNHIENGSPLLCTGEDGLAALRIHEAVA